MWLLLALLALFDQYGAQRAERKPAEPAPRLVDVSRIWGQAPHNAFTDLIRFKGRWYCAFREARTADSADGAVRILTSADGERWFPAALISYERADLRDPKFSVTPDNRLMLIASADFPPASWVRGQSVACFSSDGRDWAEPVEVGDPNFWLWRLVWRRGRAYGVGYSATRKQTARLYTSRDGIQYETLGDNLAGERSPREGSLLFLDDDSAVCLLAREGKGALLGHTGPPYRAWTWKELDLRLGGPGLLRLPDDRIVAAGRLDIGKARTSLCWLDPEAGTLKEFLALPSGGDTGYPGLVFYDGLLWVSYHSSHEGKASIYLAKVKFGD